MFTVRIKRLYITKDALDRYRDRLGACAEGVRGVRGRLQSLSGMESAEEALRRADAALGRQEHAMGELSAALERVAAAYIIADNAAGDAAEWLATLKPDAIRAHNDFSSTRQGTNVK